MKKYFLFLAAFIFAGSAVFAQNLNYNQEEYELQYSTCKGTTCINEYVRPSQNFDNWTNMVTVHHFKKQKSEADYLNAFVTRIQNNPKMYLIYTFEEKNLLSFGIISVKENGSGHIEYNVLRTEPAKEGGIKAVQFAHKYKFKDEEGFKQAYERSKKYNMKYINCLLNTPMPEIETKDYEKQ